MSDTAVDPATPQADPFPGAQAVPAAVASRGYSWPECPRWHDGALWFTDLFAGRLVRIDDAGTPTVVVDASGRTPVRGGLVHLAGFGWLPDGRLLVVSMHERLLLTWDGSALELYVDLDDVATGPVNDMVVDAEGRAYVTQLGFDLWGGEAPKDSELIVVEPDGTARALTDLGGFAGANGIAISGDGTRVVTAEAFGNTIAVLDRAPDGALTNRRVFAATPFLPDGLCLDVEGAVWVGMPGVGAGRVLDGGTWTHLVPVPADQGLSPACVLGGPDRRTLFLTAGLEVMDPQKSLEGRLGTIWTAPAPVPAGDARP